MPSYVRVTSFQNGQVWKGLFISRYVTRMRVYVFIRIKARYRIRKICRVLEQIAAGNGRFRGLPL